MLKSIEFLIKTRRHFVDMLMVRKVKR